MLYANMVYVPYDFKAQRTVDFFNSMKTKPEINLTNGVWENLPPKAKQQLRNITPSLNLLEKWVEYRCFLDTRLDVAAVLQSVGEELFLRYN